MISGSYKKLLLSFVNFSLQKSGICLGDWQVQFGQKR
jgi:hypothetical protein